MVPWRDQNDLELIFVDVFTEVVSAPSSSEDDNLWLFATFWLGGLNFVEVITHNICFTWNNIGHSELFFLVSWWWCLGSGGLRHTQVALRRSGVGKWYSGTKLHVWLLGDTSNLRVDICSHRAQHLWDVSFSLVITVTYHILERIRLNLSFISETNFDLIESSLVLVANANLKHGGHWFRTINLRCRT